MSSPLSFFSCTCNQIQVGASKTKIGKGTKNSYKTAKIDLQLVFKKFYTGIMERWNRMESDKRPTQLTVREDNMHTMTTTNLDIPTIVKVIEGEAEKLNAILSGLRSLGNASAPAAVASEIKRKYTKHVKPDGTAKSAKRTMSAEARAKISAAQKSRWAAQKAGEPSKAELADALKIATEKKMQKAAQKAAPSATAAA